MPVRVLVVDDSAFFRRRLTEIFAADAHIDVVGTAADGRQAIEQAKVLKPDVITMDIEMPVMDGISATRKIMASQPTPILMFSALTTQGAKATLDALEAGAVDFLPKRMEDISADKEVAKRQLCARVRLVGVKGLNTRNASLKSRTASAVKAVAPPKPARVAGRRGQYKVVAIGTSTGGPVALQKVLTALPADFPLPILLIQHMPATFTPAFAERLNKLCNVGVKEASDGDILKRGQALLAPGGKQMVVEQARGGAVVRILESEPGQTYKPSVDMAFTSLAEVFNADVLSVVLTGMGADGREGARLLHQKGATVWAQDEATSVIYGMPAAIADAGLADRILALEDVAANIVEIV